MMSSEQLERQTEQSRAEVEMTIEELRARLTPGQIVDEILSYGKDGGRQFTANLGRQISNNPLPVALIGAGLAWLMFGPDANASSRNTSDRRYSPGANYNAGSDSSHQSDFGDIAGKAGEFAHDAAGGVRDAAADAFGNVRHAAETAGSTVSGTARSLGDSASSAYHAASSKVGDMAARAGSKASEIEHKALMATHDIVDQVKAQPLMLIGIGLILGAAIGTAFPSTDLENRVMGDTADEVKREAKQAASEQMEKAKDFASDQIDRAKEATEDFVEDAVETSGNGAGQANETQRPAQHFG